MYGRDEMIRIAKRENNAKRSFLVVNPLQGKHLPVEPSRALLMFSELSKELKKVYGGEKLLVIGFAETATAIGAAVAIELDSFYIQTTREVVEEEDCLFFSEEHSHATEQKLIKSELDFLDGKIERILFVEDEITTGKTILNAISALQRYGKNLRFSAASLLNAMDEEAVKNYEKQGISLHYLLKAEQDAYADEIRTCSGNGVYISSDTGKKEVREFRLPFYQNTRKIVQGSSYMKACERLCRYYEEKEDLRSVESILVLGTEECMYPALYLGRHLEKKGCKVRCHATTRSPILASLEEGYPFHTRYELRSLYDVSRITYLYNIECCDKVIVVTDSDRGEQEGVNSLCNALAKAGNDNITIVRWSEK